MYATQFGRLIPHGKLSAPFIFLVTALNFV